MARSTNPFRYFDSSPEVIRLVVMSVKSPINYALNCPNCFDDTQ
jgi:hypothetical protein